MQASFFKYFLTISYYSYSIYATIISLIWLFANISINKAPPMNNHLHNDSLVYSEGGVDEEQNLLQDSTQLSTIYLQPKHENDMTTVKIQKMPNKSNLHHSLANDSLTRYLMNESEVYRQQRNGKNSKKLEKQKQKILNLDPRVQKIALNQTHRADKINELITLIETQKIWEYEKRLKEYEIELIQLADDVINQRKNLQREIQNIVELNKIMGSKMKEVERFLQELKMQNITCTCRKPYSFSKDKESPIYYLDRFQFAKTMIGSIEELELKKVEEEEGVKMSQNPLIQLAWHLKNKANGCPNSISLGLMDRVASGPTLRQWIQTISQKLDKDLPSVSDFEQKVERMNHRSKKLPQFIELLRNSQQTFIKNIQDSKDPERQMEILNFSTQMTFIQLLKDQTDDYTKQQAISYFGNMNRCLVIVSKKVGVELDQSKKISSKDILELIQDLY